MHDEYLSIEGPVERRNDRLILRIPLDAGGDKLRVTAKTISYVEGDKLVVVLPEWLAKRMKLTDGTPVHLDDRFGKLNIAKLN